MAFTGSTGGQLVATMNRSESDTPVRYEAVAEKLAELLTEIVADWGHCCDNQDTCLCSMGRASRVVRRMHQ